MTRHIVTTFAIRVIVAVGFHLVEQRRRIFAATQQDPKGAIGRVMPISSEHVGAHAGFFLPDAGRVLMQTA
jgi:hypothetical protein